MSARHTPGPWTVHQEDGWPLVMAGGPAGRIVANVNPESCPNTSSAPAFVVMPAEANARLIAAAPRMSDALKRAAHILAELQDQSPHLLALRTEIVACIKQATPEHYGVQS